MSWSEIHFDGDSSSKEIAAINRRLRDYQVVIAFVDDGERKLRGNSTPDISCPDANLETLRGVIRRRFRRYRMCRNEPNGNKRQGKSRTAVFHSLFSSRHHSNEFSE